MLLAFVLVAEYLSEKEEIPSFYVRSRMKWERHIEELTAEGCESISQIYRMEYSSFFTLCTIMSPQVQVNDEMSRCRTGKDSRSVEIMLHCLLQSLGGGRYLDTRLSVLQCL